MAAISTAAKNAVADAIGAFLDTGGAAITPLIVLFTSAPAAVRTLRIGSGPPTWAVASGGVAALAAPGLAVIHALAAFSGTVAIAAIAARTGTVHIECAIGDIGSGEEIEMAGRAIVANQDIVIHTLSIVITD